MTGGQTQRAVLQGAWRGPEKGRLDWCQAPRGARPSWLCVHGACSEVRAKKESQQNNYEMQSDLQSKEVSADLDEDHRGQPSVGEVQAGFSEEGTWNEVTCCRELQGRGHLGRFRSRKGHGELELSPVSHIV